MAHNWHYLVQIYLIMDKEIKHTYGQNNSDQNSKAGNPSVTQNPSNDGTLADDDSKNFNEKEKEGDNEIQENKSSKEQKNRVRK